MKILTEIIFILVLDIASSISMEGVPDSIPCGGKITCICVVNTTQSESGGRLTFQMTLGDPMAPDNQSQKMNSREKITLTGVKEMM